MLNDFPTHDISSANLSPVSKTIIQKTIDDYSFFSMELLQFIINRSVELLPTDKSHCHFSTVQDIDIPKRYIFMPLGIIIDITFYKVSTDMVGTQN